jgi:hypothetical protein
MLTEVASRAKIMASVADSQHRVHPSLVSLYGTAEKRHEVPNNQPRKDPFLMYRYGSP